MFEDSLLESGNRIKSKRGWTTIVSFGFEAVFIGVLILIPLIFTEALPKGQLATFLVAPPPPPPPPPPPAAVVHVVKVQTELDNSQLRTPTKIPVDNPHRNKYRVISTPHWTSIRRTPR